MVSVAFEVKLTLGSGAVVGQRDAVMLGLLGRYFAINSLFCAVRMASHSASGSASYLARTASLEVNRFSSHAGASSSLSSMPSRPAWMSRANTMYGLMQPSNERSLKRLGLPPVASGTVSYVYI